MRAKVREVIQTILIALLIFMALQASVQNFRVEGSSMDPTLRDSQYLLVNKLFYYRLDKGKLAGWLPFFNAEEGDTLYPFHPPSRGEVVVFRFPRDESRDFVKRIIGVPGDEVEIRDGRVFVNGRALQESYALGPSICSLPQTCQIRLKDGDYFVLGDNRSASNDSRDWGPVHLDNIIGRVWVSYWPFSELGFR
ncbi:MAG: signal peptidase I [Chloroflexi bacterium]|nr:signal peptidase I [Chloroflexota bacterium]